MSTTSQGIDARAYLGNWANALTGMLTADIKAIPDDKWTATHGGCTRSAADVTADALSLLVWTTEALRGHIGDNYDHSEGIKTACSTKEGATEMLPSAVAAFSSALSGASDEALETVITPPWQMPAPLFMIAQIAVSHLWYHDGQLNYIQSLLGDDKIHWMGD